MGRKSFSKNIFLLSFCLFAAFHTAVAQQKDSSTFKISGYVDAYYAYYTDSVGPAEFQKFPTISPRSNAFGLNIAMVTFQYDAATVRGTATLHYGDFPLSAWSSKYNNIQEAHAGIRLSKKLWLDAGFFRTHFGTEGALPKEKFESSVSVNTFYEPYFESGMRFDYLPSDKLTIDVYVLNGYNMFEDNNEKKSIGVVATYLLGNKGNIGYSNYIGDDTPGNSSTSHLRIHQNVFFNYQIHKTKMQAGVNYCLQQNSDTTGEKTASMYSGVLAFKYDCSKHYGVYVRGEIFNDPQGFMSTVIIDRTEKHTGYKIFGVTAGAEYDPSPVSYIRLEGRELIANKAQEIFYRDGYTMNNRFEVMMNLGVSF